MNLNVKIDGEEDQTIQYVNRSAINLQPNGPTYINLNIVNPGLSNQSYILNPVTPVGQNLVAYQSPVTLQSYIALQAEGGNNFVNNLQVGVPVPMGVPVPAGLLQNHNLSNASIIIGNEDCNSPMILKSAPKNITDHGDFKISYIQKSVDDEYNNSNSLESHNLRINLTPNMASELQVKKPCPLEMSIKAANIDLEFEKCDPEVLVTVPNGILECETLPAGLVEICQPSIERNVTESMDQVIQTKLLEIKSEILNEEAAQKTRTEITWENNNINERSINNQYQESLICEVEEANDDDEAEEEEKKLQREAATIKNESPSSEENDDKSPMNVVLRLKKVPEVNRNSKNMTYNNAKPKNNKKETSHNKKSKYPESGEETHRAAKRPQRSRKPVDLLDYSVQWSESDEEVLDIKRIKNEFNYNCYYEPKSLKSNAQPPIKTDSESKAFVKVRNCCSKKECFKKINIKDQKIAHKHFYDLESKVKQDTYLINCLEHVQNNRIPVTEGTKDESPEKCEKTPEKAVGGDSNIQMDIENESNGNQMLSDEIQNAINESLKDCLENQLREDEEKANENEKLKENEEEEKEKEKDKKKEEDMKENNWNYYIVIDRCRKKVCLQFLLKLLRITKNRIKVLQKKILSGTPITDDTTIPKTSEKFSKLWETAKLHLDTLPDEECIDCRASPRHRYFVRDVSRQNLFEEFKNFYLQRVGKELGIKYATYRKFLFRETKISFTQKKIGSCSECEAQEEQLRREKKKLEKNAGVQSKTNKLDRSIKNKKKGRKKWGAESGSGDNSSDDEPLSKRKQIKLTISLKSPNKVTSSGKKEAKRNPKKTNPDKKVKKKGKDERSRPSQVKGRDVWSLMLLHLETMPYKVCRSCVSRKKHRFFNSSVTTQALYDDYRRYFLKETNSELGLGFTMYEKYFQRNCGYSISDIDVENCECPRCALEPPKQETNKAKRNQKVSSSKGGRKGEESYEMNHSHS